MSAPLFTLTVTQAERELLGLVLGYYLTRTFCTPENAEAIDRLCVKLCHELESDQPQAPEPVNAELLAALKDMHEATKQILRYSTWKGEIGTLPLWHAASHRTNEAIARAEAALAAQKAQP